MESKKNARCAVTDMSVTWDLTRREARKKRVLMGKFQCCQFSFRFLENAKISLILSPFGRVIKFYF